MFIQIGDIRVPAFIYGAARKENITKKCVLDALTSGFRAIDSAGHRKYFDEQGVGEALYEAYSAKLAAREDIFLQSKFVNEVHQDGFSTYEENAPISVQIRQSLQFSLANLKTDYLDSYLLQNLDDGAELSEDDILAWKTLEDFQRQGKIKLIGVCNITLEKLKHLWKSAIIKPRIVQNRCDCRKGWDRQIREFCRENEIAYQAHSLLPANHHIFLQTRFQEIISRNKCTDAQLIFRFALQSGMMPITGTRDPNHMREALAVVNLQLSEHDNYLIEFI